MLTLGPSVKDTVKSELKTYSAAVKESKTSAAGPLLNSDRDILKNVIKDLLWQKMTEAGI